MSKITKLELTQLLTKANAEVEALRLRVSQLEADNAVLRKQSEAPAPAASKPVPQRTANKVVYEWDPKVPGDFKAKSLLVQQFGGVLRRVQEQRA